MGTTSVIDRPPARLRTKFRPAAVDDGVVTDSAVKTFMTEEELSVLEWRYSQLRALGFDREAARELAEGPAELALVRRLVADGCPHELAIRIVL
jgi:hypothetical protein